MTINLTKYYVEVAGQYTDGELRVYRQYVDVLYLPPTTNIWTESVADTLNITDSGVGARVFNFYDVLAFTDRTPVEIPLSISQVVTFGQAATKPVFVSANNTLTFLDSEFEFNFVGDRQVPYNTLNLVQTLVTLSGIAMDNTLNFQQTVNVYNTSRYVSASDWLHLFQYTPTTHRQWLTDSLAFISRGRVPFIRALSNTLAFVQLGRMTNIGQHITFVQTAEAAFGYTLISYLELQDVQAMLALYTRHQYQTLGIGHSLGWYMDSPCSRKQYTPFQGENTIPGALTPPAATLPYVQVSPMTDRMLLYYPAKGPRTYNTVLRAPEMDNRDRNSYTRVSRETSGGKLVVFADPTWPRVRTMVVTIIGLQKTAVDSFQTLKQATLGQEIGITDWEGRMWAGVITNPSEAVTQDGPTSWTITFEFEGELVDGQFPGDAGLALSDSVSYVLV